MQSDDTSLSNCAEGFHRTHPFDHQVRQLLLLCFGTSDEATLVPLPPLVVDLEAKTFKGCTGNLLILGFANVVRFARLREVPIRGPKLEEEV